MKFQAMQHTARSARQRAGRYLTPALALFVAAGCDTDVTNPGPVQDEFLDSLNAHSAVVTGAGPRRVTTSA